MGLGTRTKAWRFTDINKDYTVSKAANLSAQRLTFRSSTRRPIQRNSWCLPGSPIPF